MIRDDERAELEPPILQGLGQVVPQVDPPSELRARVLSVAVALAGDRSARPVRSLVAGDGRLARARGGLTIYSASSARRIAGLEGELRDTRTRADAAQQQMADARRTAADAQTAVAILTAPDVARVDLAGQPASPKHRRRRSGAGHAAWCSTRRTSRRFLRDGRINCGWSPQAPISAGL